MTPLEFQAWRTRLSLTPDEAASSLGISRKTVDRYSSANATIPYPLSLACRLREIEHLIKDTP